MKYILVNGELLPQNSEIFTANDLQDFHTTVKSTIRIEEGKLLLPELQWLKIIQACNELCCMQPARFTTSVNFNAEMSRLVERNELERGSIQLQILQSGKYVAETSTLQSSIFDFPLVGERLTSKAYDSELLLPNWFRKNTIWKSELQHTEVNGFSNLFVKNKTTNHITETLHGCFFVVYEFSLILVGYQPENANCFTTEFLHRNTQYGFSVQQFDSIPEEVLLEAEEVFWFNDAIGVQWVLSYKDRRFYNKTTREVYLKFTGSLRESIK